VWNNPLLVSPATAEEWKCHSYDVVKLKCGKGDLTAPVYVQAGTNDAVVAMALGAAGLEYFPYHSAPDANPMHVLTGDMDEDAGALSWVGTPVIFEGVVGHMPLAKQQGSHKQDDRGIAQNVGLGKVGSMPEIPMELPPASESELYPTYKYPRYRWGMVIDLAACIGCGACVVACQAENNVMVVGKKLCLNGRILQWLRIERFYANGRVVFLPMLCQQCGQAPCESVCPVYASVHNSEGLNLQVYNRCVGTRYCANNCPYKVRRFNWFTYTVDPPLEKAFNPDVSIRTRGIMEKCTFCIQRIRTREENARLEGRPLREGEVVPACAQSCPTRAILFGDINDPNSELTKRMKNPRGYRIFDVLNTKSSIVYLKRVYHEDAAAITGLEG
jgi:Fe-S-cluster-containing dehydrogenase component